MDTAPQQQHSAHGLSRAGFAGLVVCGRRPLFACRAQHKIALIYGLQIGYGADFLMITSSRLGKKPRKYRKNLSINRPFGWTYQPFGLG
jgi:hypothetical protein